jgi:hypothetical protein
MELKEKKCIEFIIVKVDTENEYLTEESIGEYKKFVRDYDENLFLLGGKVCIEGDDRLWIIREIVYNEEYDINIIYVINRCTELNIHE